MERMTLENRLLYFLCFISTKYSQKAVENHNDFNRILFFFIFLILKSAFVVNLKFIWSEMLLLDAHYRCLDIGVFMYQIWEPVRS